MPDNQPTTPAAAAPAESAAAQPVAQSPQERLREITAGIEQGIQNLFQSERYAQYLRTMSHFHHYSLNNTMLIYLQKPDATLVAGYDKWKNQFERHVNRGEKGIKILAPVPYTVKQTREKRDPQTRAVLLDASGQAQTEEVEVRLTHYRVVPVFDVSQTDGKPLPTIVNDLQGNVEHFDAFMEAVFRTSPVPIEITSIDNGADGFFSPSRQQINIREGMSEVQTVSAVIHEMAHAKLHDYNRRQQEATDIVDAKPKDRHTEEVEAESVSYAVCQYRAYVRCSPRDRARFAAAHQQELELHRAAKQSFDALGGSRLPTVKEINAEFETLRRQKGKLYGEYQQAKKERAELLTIRANLELILDRSQHEIEQEAQRNDR